MDAIFGMAGDDFVIVCADKTHCRSIVKMDVRLPRRSRAPRPRPACCGSALPVPRSRFRSLAIAQVARLRLRRFRAHARGLAEAGCAFLVLLRARLCRTAP